MCEYFGCIKREDGSLIVSDAHCDFDCMSIFPRNFMLLDPLLCDVSDANVEGVDWIIIGQQTGPDAKPTKDEWVRSIIERCRAAGVPVFVKKPLFRRWPVQQWPLCIKQLYEEVIL